MAARMRPGQDLDDVQTATKFALRSVARRYQALSQEIAELDAQLDRLVAEVTPELISLPAIGTDHAATLLLTVGDNSERLGSEASFASLCRCLACISIFGKGRKAPSQPRRKPGRQPLSALDLRSAHAGR